MTAVQKKRGARLPAFVADKKGLEKILARRGKHFAVVELVQNALDENVTTVDVVLEPNGKRGRHTLRVTDDSPDGFADLRHAYTIFAESNKKSDPTKMGRFNLGEKLVVACCDRATITTTTGCVKFDGDTRSHGRKKTEAGSVFEGVIRMTLEEAKKTAEVAKQVLVPKGVKLTFNGEVIETRQPVAQFEATLATEISDEDGYLRPTKRKTKVRVYEARDGETPMLYEIALPVVETNDKWHVSIGQKVPLNMDRDNVTPAYLRKVRTLVLNEMADMVPEEDAAAPWIGEALEDPDIADDAVQAVLTKRYGDKRVIRDPSDPEANAIAVSKGYAVIEPRSHSRQQWEAIRRSGAARPAGQITPSPKPFHPDGRALKLIDKDKWTPGMQNIAGYAEAIGRELLGKPISVRIANDRQWGFSATYGSGRLTLNAGVLGKRWFDRGVGEEVNKLLIHEFAHQYEGNHLSDNFHSQCCRLGAKMVELALDNPEFFDRWD